MLPAVAVNVTVPAPASIRLSTSNRAMSPAAEITLTASAVPLVVVSLPNVIVPPASKSRIASPASSTVPTFMVIKPPAATACTSISAPVVCVTSPSAPNTTSLPALRAILPLAVWIPSLMFKSDATPVAVKVMVSAPVVNTALADAVAATVIEESLVTRMAPEVACNPSTPPKVPMFTPPPPVF